MLLPFRRSLSLPLPLFFCSFLRGDIISNGVDLLAELSLTQPVPVFLVSPLPLFPDHPQRVSSPRCSSPCSSFSPLLPTKCFVLPLVFFPLPEEVKPDSGPDPEPDSIPWPVHTSVGGEPSFGVRSVVSAWVRSRARAEPHLWSTLVDLASQPRLLLLRLLPIVIFSPFSIVLSRRWHQISNTLGLTSPDRKLDRTPLVILTSHR